MTQNARRLDAFGLDPASMLWTTQGRLYGPPTLLANLAMAHPCLLAARFLLSARPPDLLQFVCSMSQGRPPSRNRTRDDLDGPNPGSRPINVPDPTRAPGLLPIFLLLLSSRLFRIALICGPHIPGHCRPVACRFRPHPANARSLSSFRLDTFDRSSKILTTY